jgi:hypothetical protein
MMYSVVGIGIYRDNSDDDAKQESEGNGRKL